MKKSLQKTIENYKSKKKNVIVWNVNIQLSKSQLLENKNNIKI